MENACKFSMYMLVIYQLTIIIFLCKSIHLHYSPNLTYFPGIFIIPGFFSSPNNCQHNLSKPNLGCSLSGAFWVKVYIIYVYYIGPA